MVKLERGLDVERLMSILNFRVMGDRTVKLDQVDHEDFE